MKRAFTLIETIIVIAITAMALLALITLILMFYRIQGQHRALMEVNVSAATSMNAFVDAILPASKILPSANTSGLPYVSSNTSLVLELPSIDASGYVIPGVVDHIVFTLAGQTLTEQIEAGVGSVRQSTSRVLSTAVSSLTFTYDDPTLVNVTNVLIDLRTRASYQQTTMSAQVSEKLYIRNKLPT
jgi:type II secretory pathway pseudopilin PulG